MMGFLGRFVRLPRVWWQEFLLPAEDPRQSFAYVYRRQRELLVNVQQAIADIASSKTQLETKTAEMREKLPGLKDQARRALIAGREDLARLALRRRYVAALELQALEEQVWELEQEEQRLSLIEQRLATQLEAFHARRKVVAARYSAAEAQVRITEALAGISTEVADLGLALEQAEQRAEHMQARASAIDSLVEAGVLEVPGLPAGDALERKLAQLDLVQVVEDQLATLKGRLGEGV